MSLPVPAALALMCFCGQPTFGCSFADLRFEPDADFEPFSADGEYFGPLPAPIIRSLAIKRGTEATGFSCADAGSMSVTIAMPDDAHYSLDDVGVFFRVFKGEDTEEIVPNVPLVSTERRRFRRYSFHWLDGAPSEQQPIDFILEAFFVAKDLSIGPSVFFQVRSTP